MQFLKKNKYSILRQILRYGFVVAIVFSFTATSFIVNADEDLNVTTGIVNPTSIDNIQEFIVALINIVLLIGVPIVTLAIIYSGFLFVQASGNSEKLGTAKKALLYSVIGAALLLGAFVLAEAIKGTVDQLK